MDREKVRRLYFSDFFWDSVVSDVYLGEDVCAEEELFLLCRCVGFYLQLCCCYDLLSEQVATFFYGFFRFFLELLEFGCVARKGGGRKLELKTGGARHEFSCAASLKRFDFFVCSVVQAEEIERCFFSEFLAWLWERQDSYFEATFG